jgi:hypothetical protein
MATVTFIPKSSTSSANWEDPTIWSGDVVPNDPSVDVVISTPVSGQPTTITAGAAHSIGSLSISNDYLTLTASLTIAHDVNISPGAIIDTHVSMSVGGSLTNNGMDIGSRGSLSVSGLFQNQSLIVGDGLTVTAGSFTNTGQLQASGGDLTVTVAPGGFTNLSGSTLTGGAYTARGGSVYLNVGGLIATDAATINLDGGMVYSYDDVGHAYISVNSSLHSIAASGTLSLGASQGFSPGDLTVDGSVALSSGSDLHSTRLTVDAGGVVSSLGGTIRGPVVDNGTIIAGFSQPQAPRGTGLVTPTLDITGPVSGTGTLEVGFPDVIFIPASGGKNSIQPASLELGAAVSSNVVFVSNVGILTLDAPSTFSGQISPISGDEIFLNGIAFSSVTGFSYSGNSSAGTLAIHTASSELDLGFRGDFETTDFSLAANGSTSLLLTVNVTPPIIQSNGGGDTATVTIPENTTAVTTVVATGHSSVSYGIVGGSDAAKFHIDASTGVLSFVAPPDFETPLDLDHNNSYIVQVSASDRGVSDTQTITVSITDVNDTVPPAPTPPTLHWTRSVDVGPHPAGWLPAGIGDFNGDATSDLAWYNASTNGIDIWKLSNGQWAGSSDLGSHPAGYQPAGFGDFNHDGTSDVLWFNPTTRDVDVWKLSNGQWAGNVGIGSHPAGWLPSGVGDFNGDGTSDVLWYNASTRDADIWKITNGQWAGSVDNGTHPAGYQPSLTGDFNGDGTSDIAWYNPTTGDVDIWMISNAQWAGSVDPGAHPAGWQPLGAADFNLDGTSDIVWYNPTTNDIDIWLIKNGQWAGSIDIGTHPAGSIAVGVGDFDHNGVPDIMWRDTTTGHIDNWMLAYS